MKLKLAAIKRLIRGVSYFDSISIQRFFDLHLRPLEESLDSHREPFNDCVRLMLACNDVNYNKSN